MIRKAFSSKLSVILIIILFPFCLFAGDNDSFTAGYYWVSFLDKEYSPYSLDNPEEFLSDASIQRRIKFDIELNDMDLPVSPIYVDSVSDVASVLYTSKWFNAALVKIQSVDEYTDIMGFSFFRDIRFAKSLSTKKTNKISKSPPHYSDDFDFYSHLLTSINYNGLYSFATPLNDYGQMGDQIRLLNGDKLHNDGYWGEGVSIALLDAGYTNVDYINAFSHLWDSDNVLGYYNIVDDGQSVFDSHYHGTMVLSVMAANIPGEVKGAAPEASYWLIRTEDASTEYIIEEYNWLKGAEIADSAGVYIINSSLGYSEFDDSSQNYTYEDLDGVTSISAQAANYAHDRGILVFSSAGNYGSGIWLYIGTPADSFGAIAVGATNLDGERASFSSIGPSADGRVKPDVMAPGENVTVIDTDGFITYSNGTSFSSPILAAVAACLWEEFPEKSNDVIKEAIIRSASHYLDPDEFYGYGIPDFTLARIILNNDFSLVNNYSGNKSVSINPNPLSESSYIAMFANKPDVAVLKIYNINGQQVYSLNDIQISNGYNKIYPFGDFMSFPQGVYIVKLSTQTEKYSIKAVKAN
ncbi:MAG: S8 family serine peptidase [Bacteroidota bacterium]